MPSFAKIPRHIPAWPTASIAYSTWYSRPVYKENKLNEMLNFRLSISLIGCVRAINPLTPESDQDRISPNHIMQTSAENKGKYQLLDYWLIKYQILQANIMRIIWQTVRRITNEILGVQWWNNKLNCAYIFISSHLCSVGGQTHGWHPIMRILILYMT